MKRMLLTLLLFALPAVVAVEAQKNANSANSQSQERQSFKGIALQKSRATPKRGYKFEKTSDNTFVLRRANGGSTPGLGYAIECKCAPGVPSTCISEISSTEAKCKGDTCCSFRLAAIKTTPTRIQ